MPSRAFPQKTAAEPAPVFPEAGAPFAFVGDALCLDFANTIVQGRELLTDFEALLRWLEAAGALTATAAAEARERWGGLGQAAGKATLRDAWALRAALQAAVAAIVASEAVPAATLAVLNPLLARSPARAELVAGKGGRPVKRYRLHVKNPADLLAPVAESAADVLANVDYALIRRCANPACTRVFLDCTKNHRRRWCTMDVCGNRAKAAAHRARKKAGVAN